MVGLSLFSNQGCEIGLSETENPSLDSSVGWGGGGERGMVLRLIAYLVNNGEH